MAGNFNKVFLMGNLTRDVELRRLPQTNQAIASFGIAVNHRFKTAAGEAKEEVTFVDCDAWGKTAETMAQYLSKGRPVFIEGRLRLDQWQDKETGQNRSKLKVVVLGFQFIDSRGGGAAGGSADGGPGVQVRQGRPAAPAAAGGAPAEAGAGYEPIQEDDIPF